jgi:hypothetical protein
MGKETGSRFAFPAALYPEAQEMRLRAGRASQLEGEALAADVALAAVRCNPCRLILCLLFPQPVSKHPAQVFRWTSARRSCQGL